MVVRPFSLARRNVLGTLATGWFALFLLPLAKGILDYLTPAAASTASLGTRAFALKAEQLAPDSAKILKIFNGPVTVVRTSGGQFKAFSSRCTHLGCVVQYVADNPAPHFECHCHGSRFDANGNNIAGPAPRPLDRLKVEVDGEDVYVVKA